MHKMTYDSSTNSDTLIHSNLQELCPTAPYKINVLGQDSFGRWKFLYPGLCQISAKVAFVLDKLG